MLKQWHLRVCESEKARTREKWDRGSILDHVCDPAACLLHNGHSNRWPCTHTQTHPHTHTEQLSPCLPLLYPFRRPQCPNHHDRDSCVCGIETENGRVFVTGACAWNDNSLSFTFFFSLLLHLPFFHFYNHYPQICNVLSEFILFEWAHVGS